MNPGGTLTGTWLRITHRLMPHRGFVVYGRLMIHGMTGSASRALRRRSMMPRCRARGHPGLVMTTGGVVHRRPMMSRRGTVTGVMTGWVMRGHAHAMNMRRVVPVTAVPRSGPPVGHQAGRREGSKGKDCRTRRRITIDGPAIIVAENRETIHIIAGVGPGSRGAPPRAAHADRGTRVHRIIVHRATAQHQRRACHHRYVFHLLLHGCLRVVPSEKRMTSAALFPVFNFSSAFLS